MALQCVFLIRDRAPSANAGVASISATIVFGGSPPLYRIFVAEVAGISDVMVQGADGQVDNSSTSKRILSLLLEQLK